MPEGTIDNPPEQKHTPTKISRREFLKRGAILAVSFIEICNKF